MYNRILVPLDGSPLAERALAHAELFARVFQSNLILLQVLDPSPYRENVSVVEPLNWQLRKAEADLYLKGVADRVHEKGIPVEYVLREGRAPETIIDFAHAENIDLLVISTHGISGLSRWNASSIFNKVISKIYLPVLVVRSYLSELPAQEAREQAGQSALPAAGAGSGAPGPMPPSIPITTTTSPAPAESANVIYQNILLPIDCSRRAECALPAGTTLVSQMDPHPRLILAAVIKPPEAPLPTPYLEEIRQLSESLMQVSREAVGRYLQELQDRLPENTETRVVENDSISAAIHELVDQENIDLVILCAHGTTGRVNWPYGSVAQNYIDHGVKPVLVIQDVPRSQVRPTAAEIAAEKSGRR